MNTNKSTKTIASVVAVSIVLLCSLPAQARGIGGHGFNGGRASGMQAGGRNGALQGGAFQNQGLIGRGGEQRQFPNQGNHPNNGKGNRQFNNHPTNDGNFDNNTRTVSGNGDTTNNYSYTNNASRSAYGGAYGGAYAHPGAPYAAAGYAYGHSTAPANYAAYPPPYAYPGAYASLPIGMGLGAMLANTSEKNQQPVVVQQTTQPAQDTAQVSQQARLNGQQFAQGIAEVIRANALRNGQGFHGQGYGQYNGQNYGQSSGQNSGQTYYGTAMPPMEGPVPIQPVAPFGR